MPCSATRIPAMRTAFGSSGALDMPQIVVAAARSAGHTPRPAHPIGVPMLGVVPGGSANVFARAMGLPVNPVEATHRLLHAIEDGRSRRVGLGLVAANGGPRRWFTFNAGIGWDADVVADVDRKRGKRT